MKRNKNAGFRNICEASLRSIDKPPRQYYTQWQKHGKT